MKVVPGDEVAIRAEGDAITIQPVRTKSILKKEMGIWVCPGPSSSQSPPGRLTTASIQRMIDKERSKRLRGLL
jgi:virulence-associated protein VagC